MRCKDTDAIIIDDCSNYCENYDAWSDNGVDVLLTVTRYGCWRICELGIWILGLRIGKDEGKWECWSEVVWARDQNDQSIFDH